MLHSLIFILSTTVVQADLKCLAWGFILTPVGLFCHFKHEKFNAVENATVQAVEDFANDIKDAVEFKVEHHPLVLDYDWASTAISNGSSAADTQLVGQIKQEIKVDIGFGKEIVNTGVTIFEMTHWYDFAFCLMESARNTTNVTKENDLLGNPTLSAAVSLASNDNSSSAGGIPLNGVSDKSSGVATSRRESRGTPSLEASKAIVAKCANEKFKQLANPAVFNITDPHEKIGSTLAQIASFFVSIGPEEEGTNLAVNSFDLAIPGSEDAGRIYEKVGTESQHFSTEAKALAVKEKLKDSSWIESNCITCPAPGGPSVGKIKRRRASSPARTFLARRGSVLSMCCEAVKGIRGLDWSFDTPHPNGNTQNIEAAQQQITPQYDPTRYLQDIPEESLSPPPKLVTWSDAKYDRTGILRDLEAERTAVLAWSPGITDNINSKGSLRNPSKRVQPNRCRV